MTVLNKTYVMELVPDGSGKITIPGAEKMSKQHDFLWVGYGPRVPCPPGWVCKWHREIFAIAIAQNLATHQWIVMANGDDGSWDSIDPEHNGVRPRDYTAGYATCQYRSWALDCEHGSGPDKITWKGVMREYDEGSVPDWDSPQTISMHHPILEINVDATVTRAKTSAHKDLLGEYLPQAVEDDDE